MNKFIYGKIRTNVGIFESIQQKPSQKPFPQGRLAALPSRVGCLFVWLIGWWDGHLGMVGVT